jgi:replicative DNA helicase
MTTASAISDITAEAGVIASVVLKPEFTFYSEQLRPNHFTDPQNAYIYYAVCELAKAGIENVDAYNIFNQLHANSIAKRAIEGIQQSSDTITIQAVNDLIDIAPTIARATVEEYMSLVNNVLGAAFRRNTYEKLIECQKLCFDSTCEDIEQKIYSTLDGVMMEFASRNEVPQYKDVVDDMWQQIESRQGQDGISGIPFKFPTLNAYCTIEPGELFIVAAEAKQGKSMFLLNCAADLLKQDLKVLYIDSELNTRLFTCRLISHLTGIEYRRLKAGRYDEEEQKQINNAIAWLKTRNFTHLYMPIFDMKSIYTVVKKVKHTMGIDVLVIDYFKSTGDGDAFATYSEMGRITDLIKNTIAGSMNIAAIGAAQATSSGKIADSAKIGRNASTIALLQDKTPDEIQQDGAECGNKKLKIVLNRNGAQMSDGEYIDLMFRGDFVSYEEAKQHIPVTPF